MNYIDPRFDCKTEALVHDSCCAIYNGPAMPVGPCDCGVQSDSGDEQPQPMIDWNAVFAVPEEQASKETIHQELVARDLKVKAETPEERERLWKLVQQYAGS